jgi:AcrR family transcriptional regulator
VTASRYGGPMPRPKQRTGQLRDHVLAIAVSLLSRDGVTGFTTRSIAREAQTSTPAVYELFGDKGGLLREVFFEGFRMLRARLDTLRDSPDTRADLVSLIEVYRGFIRENPVLAELMFSRPFTEFEPGPVETAAGAAVRDFIVAHVRRCIEAGVIVGDETDIAHVLVSLTQGLALAERAERLGSSNKSIERRWALAIGATLDGLGGAR